jgi:hypothetical protein
LRVADFEGVQKRELAKRLNHRRTGYPVEKTNPGMEGKWIIYQGDCEYPERAERSEMTQKLEESKQLGRK